MPCLCVTNKSWANLTQSQILNLLTHDLHIRKNETGLAKNKRISRADPRQSSDILGSVGSAVICVMFGLLFLADVQNLMFHVRAYWTDRPDMIRQLERKTTKNKVKKQLKSKKPADKIV